MKIEGQGMAAEIVAVKNEGSKAAAEKSYGEDKPKVGLEVIKTKQPIDAARLKSSVEIVNEAIKISNLHLEFRLYKDSGRYQVSVVDSDSQKVIRQIPSDDVLEFQAKVTAMLDEMIGLLVDERI
ncbi:MAG: flagellar protein FlaG [Syntrophomonas sp.]|nr:flagellar protein FlaG [Syntrophomonas sp.]